MTPKDLSVRTVSKNPPEKHILRKHGQQKPEWRAIRSEQGNWWRLQTIDGEELGSFRTMLEVKQDICRQVNHSEGIGPESLKALFKF